MEEANLKPCASQGLSWWEEGNGSSSGLNSGITPLPEASFKTNIVNERSRLMSGLALCKICEFDKSCYFNATSLAHELIMVMMWLVRRNSEGFAPKSGLLRKNSTEFLNNILSQVQMIHNLQVEFLPTKLVVRGTSSCFSHGRSLLTSEPTILSSGLKYCIRNSLAGKSME